MVNYTPIRTATEIPLNDLIFLILEILQCLASIKKEQNIEVVEWTMVATAYIEAGKVVLGYISYERK